MKFNKIIFIKSKQEYCLYRSFIKRQTNGTSSDNEWYNEWYNEGQRVVQRVTTSGTTSDNEGQRVAISANSSFFRIREESTTKHPKVNKEDLEEQRDIELRAEGRP